jgi:hypothetical protein
MKRTQAGPRKSPKLPRAWVDAEYAALRFNAADTCDDRVTEDIYEFEDEREEVDVIVHGLDHSAN